MANMSVLEIAEQMQRWRREAEFEAAKDQRKESKDGKTKKPGSFRKGKTYRDRERGAAARNESNKAARRAWNNTTTGTRSHANFPWHTCNGKRNRIMFTGKGGKTVRLDVSAKSGMR